MPLSNDVVNIISINTNKIHERILKRMESFSKLNDNNNVLLFLAHFVSLDYLIKDNNDIVENNYPEFASCIYIKDVLDLDHTEPDLLRDALINGYTYHPLWGCERLIGLGVEEYEISCTTMTDGIIYQNRTQYKFSFFPNKLLPTNNNISIPFYVELRKYTDDECEIKRSYYTIFESDNSYNNNQILGRVNTLLQHTDIELFKIKISSLITNNSVEFVRNVLNQLKKDI
jgi:hypothetical protein